MFVIDTPTNSIRALNKKTFAELGFKERAHLQEWIAGNPEAFGEKLLIIQKEFSDFSDTNERLDLLALDKKGNLAIIENKLDDSGKDVTWQALKYASYCSTLTKEEIRNIFQSYLDATASGKHAVDILQEFFDDADYSEIVINQRMTQRIILVAANFRKEVTSTVLWLMNFKIQLQCFKATPYEFNGQYFLTLDQIIPTKDAQDYVISMANKAQEERMANDELNTRQTLRLKFWAEFLKAIKGNSNIYQNSNPTRDYTLYAGGTGITYVSYNAVIGSSSSNVSLNFGRGSTEENKLLFDTMYKHKEAVETRFGEPLVWERNDDLKKSAVSFYKQGQSYFNVEEWPEIINFLIENINRLEKALWPHFSELKQVLKQTSKESIDTIEEIQ